MRSAEIERKKIKNNCCARLGKFLIFISMIPLGELAAVYGDRIFRHYNARGDWFIVRGVTGGVLLSTAIYGKYSVIWIFSESGFKNYFNPQEKITVTTYSMIRDVLSTSIALTFSGLTFLAADSIKESLHRYPSTWVHTLGDVLGHPALAWGIALLTFPGDRMAYPNIINAGFNQLRMGFDAIFATSEYNRTYELTWRYIEGFRRYLASVYQSRGEQKTQTDFRTITTALLEQLGGSLDLENSLDLDEKKGNFTPINTELSTLLRGISAPALALRFARFATHNNVTKKFLEPFQPPRESAIRKGFRWLLGNITSGITLWGMWTFFDVAMPILNALDWVDKENPSLLATIGATIWSVTSFIPIVFLSLTTFNLPDTRSIRIPLLSSCRYRTMSILGAILVLIGALQNAEQAVITGEEKATIGVSVISPALLEIGAVILLLTRETMKRLIGNDNTDITRLICTLDDALKRAKRGIDPQVIVKNTPRYSLFKETEEKQHLTNNSSSSSGAPRDDNENNESWGAWAWRRLCCARCFR